MSNTLTNLIPDAYKALDVVSREMVGFIPAVTTDVNANRAAVNQVIRSFVAPAASSENITAGTNPPDTGDQTIGSETLTISKSKAVPFRWEGEEELSVSESFSGLTIRQQQIAQAFRTLVNEVEVDIATEARKSASRAYGSAGTTPWSSDISDSAELQRILDDNGCPMGDRQLVVNTAAAAKLGSLHQLTAANEAGSDAALRRGELLDLHGFSIRKSAGLTAVTKGTGSGYLVDLVAGYSAGDTTIHVDTGTGTILAGDVITFADDSNKYVVKTGFAGDGDGDIVLAEPGLQQSLANDKAVTITSNFTPSVGFARSSIALAARMPAMPEGGDSASDVMPITDPVSGITFELAMYPEFRRTRYQVGLAWGVAGIKREHAALLLG